MNKIIDILGNKLRVGDICAYIKAERTGSSTVRKILHTGKITSIKNGGKFVFDDNITVYVSNDIVKLENPVVHGRWIERDDFNLDTYFDCSVCGESFCFIEGDPDMSLYLYCPNCGAKMDGDS